MINVLKETKLMDRKWSISIVLPFIFLLTFVLLPLTIQGYWLRVLTSVFMYAIMAQSVNIIAGYSGYPALGNIVFFGTGAYVTAMAMTHWHFPFFLALLIAGLACAFYAFIIGLPVLRLRGRYFLMATIALTEATRQVVTNLEITGGGKGLTLPVFQGTPQVIYSFFYYLMFGILVACIITTFLLARSRVGYALKAIRYDEDAASVMGINAVIYKVLAWVISAFFTGLAGSVFAYWMTFIEPVVVYEIVTSVKMYLMFVFGGAGTLWGPILGAFFIEIISELVWSNFMELHYLVLGTIIILVVLFMPKGLMDLLKRIVEKLKFKKLQNRRW
ncbi:MAG TPA: branched-chain amino acid ABC transporter permease [Clostridia bacterium]|nr:branched-chain amino acid ABC transporter permease [Clostridia bacterium]